MGVLDSIVKAVFGDLTPELMSNETFDFAALESKYNGFRTPCCWVSVGGKDIRSDLKLHPSDIRIQQTIEGKSGQCSFTVVNAYDLSRSRFEQTLLTGLMLGMEVSAGIGYTNPVMLFKGYVADVKFSYQAGSIPTAKVTCNDIRALMLQNKLCAMLPITPFSVLMPYLMLFYTKLLNMRVIYFDFWNILEDFRQNCDDFHYLYNYGVQRGYEFFVLGDYTYFRKKWMNPNHITILKRGEGLLSFDRNYTYGTSQIKATMNNLNNLIPFALEMPLNPSGLHKMAVQKPPAIELDTSNAKNSLDLMNIVASYIIGLGDEMVGGTGCCVGLPEVVPGRYIRIAGMDDSFLDGDYYINEVTHTFDKSGYKTEFKIKGKK